MSKLAKIIYTTEEGGGWIVAKVHSFRLPNGATWDAVNGWRKHEYCGENGFKDAPKPTDQNGLNG